MTYQVLEQNLRYDVSSFGTKLKIWRIKFWNKT